MTQDITPISLLQSQPQLSMLGLQRYVIYSKGVTLRFYSFQGAWGRYSVGILKSFLTPLPELTQN